MTEADASAREALSSDQKREASLLVSELIVAPIPPASELKEYEHVVPGSADRIIAMAENEQRHRHRMETFGLLSGFVLGIVGSRAGYSSWQRKTASRRISRALSLRAEALSLSSTCLSLANDDKPTQATIRRVFRPPATDHASAVS